MLLGSDHNKRGLRSSIQIQPGDRRGELLLATSDQFNGLNRQNLCGDGTGTDTMPMYRSHLSSHIRSSVKVKHNIMQTIFPSPGPI